MSININKGFLVSASLVLACASGMGEASAADVFAEPVSSRAGNGYALTVFPAAGDEGVSFTLQLPKGLKGVDLSKCGGSQDDGFSRCVYSVETGKFNVVLLRLDGEPLSAREYSLGQVILPGVAREKLQAVEPSDVIGAKREWRSAARRDRDSTKSEL